MSLLPAPSSPLARTDEDTAQESRRFALTLPAEASAVPVARRLLTSALRSWHLDPEDADRAELVVGELAANAAQYGGAEFSVAADFCPADGRLVLAVTDFGARRGPCPPRECEGDERGRGMLIVESLAECLRVTRGHDLYRVTVELLLAMEPGDGTARALTGQAALLSA